MATGVPARTAAINRTDFRILGLGASNPEPGDHTEYLAASMVQAIDTGDGVQAGDMSP